MKRLLLITAMTVTSSLFSAATWGEWSVLAETKDIVLSVSFASVEGDSDYIKYWQLVDLREKVGNISSVAEYIRLDCSRKVKKYQRLQVITYAKSQGNDPISNEKVADSAWMYAAPESIYEQTFQQLCDAVQSINGS